MGLGSARPVPAGAEVGVAGLTGLTAAKGPSSERRAAPYGGPCGEPGGAGGRVGLDQPA